MQFTTQNSTDAFVQAVQKGLRLLELLLNWATMLFTRQRFMHAAMTLGKVRIGFSEDELREWTVTGCSVVKGRMMEFMQAWGHIADIHLSTDQFLQELIWVLIK